MVRWRSLLIGGVISAGCIALLLRTVDLQQTGDAFAHADGRWLLVFLGWTAAALFVRCWKWQLLFLPDDHVSLRGAFSASVIGYMFNTLLPGRVGELVRAALISQSDGVSVARALGTILIEKILDVLVLLLLLGVLAAFVPVPSWIARSGVAAAIVFGVLTVVFFALGGMREQVVRLVARYVDPLPIARRVRPSRLVDTLLGSARCFSRPHLVALQVLTSVALWAFAWLQVAAVMRAFSVPAPWTATPLLLATTNLGMTVPAAPGSVGVYEQVAQLTLGLFGVEPGLALAAALAMHALGFGAFTLLGAIMLVIGLAQRRFTFRGLLNVSTAGSGTGTTAQPAVASASGVAG